MESIEDLLKAIKYFKNIDEPSEEIKELCRSLGVGIELIKMSIEIEKIITAIRIKVAQIRGE